ncbi:MAG TPA: cupin domain-containing protein [Actinospica sp.]|nr:cupin domain-containing protein [Actinospica sp.]
MSTTNDDGLNGPVGLDAVAWQPKIAVRFNGFDAKVARFEGEFAWHVHEEVDEFFLVLAGQVTIMVRELADGAVAERGVELGPHDTFVVPRGVEHRPVAPKGASVLMVEPAGTVNVGDRHEELPAHITATTGALPGD